MSFLLRIVHGTYLRIRTILSVAAVFPYLFGRLMSATVVFKWWKAFDQSRLFWVLVILTATVATAVQTIETQRPLDPIFVQEGVWTDGEQGWTQAQREKFYQTSQGSLVFPYSWFVSMEIVGSTAGDPQLFKSPQYQSRYGLIPDRPTSPFNPDNLPIGIVKEEVPDSLVDLLGEGHKVWASITCAACHTANLRYEGVDIRVDGGQSFWAFGLWSQSLAVTLAYNVAAPPVFDRFAQRVLEMEGREDNAAERKALRTEIDAFFKTPLLTDAFDALFNHIYPTVEGFARTAALGRGVNGELGALSWSNIKRGFEMVSFPPLWYTHDYDWVQSTGAIRQPLGRNMTESWGVSVHVALSDPTSSRDPAKRTPYGPSDRYKSTHAIPEMVWMETLLGVLESPTWPAQYLGEIDQAKVERGRFLYEEFEWSLARSADAAELEPSPAAMIGEPNANRPTTGLCARCHAPAVEPTPNYFTQETCGNCHTQDPGYNYYSKNTIFQLPLYKFDVMGTDSFDAVQFNARRPFTTAIADDFGGREQVGIGDFLHVVITKIQDRWFDGYFTSNNIPEAERDSIRSAWEGHRPNLFRAPLGYPARPLAGYWALPPHLHNGSVRDMYQLLSPVSERDVEFYLGTYDFDPERLGYSSVACKGCFKFDTRLRGNSNAGHEFRDADPSTPGVVGPTLAHDDRMAIIEYLKVMNDVRAYRDTSQIYREELCYRYQWLYDWSEYFEGTPEQPYGEQHGCQIDTASQIYDPITN